MEETEINIAGIDDTAARSSVASNPCSRLTADDEIAGSVKSYPGCTHWHWKRDNEAGTLEVTLWPARRRIWFKIQAARRSGWIDQLVPCSRRTWKRVDAVSASATATAIPLRECPRTHAGTGSTYIGDFTRRRACSDSRSSRAPPRAAGVVAVVLLDDAPSHAVLCRTRSRIALKSSMPVPTAANFRSGARGHVLEVHGQRRGRRAC